MFMDATLLWTPVTTLPPACLYCEFAFRAHFQWVVRTDDLNCVEKENQRVPTQAKIREYSYEMRIVSAFTNQVAFSKIRYWNVLTLLKLNLV